MRSFEEFLSQQNESERIRTLASMGAGIPGGAGIGALLGSLLGPGGALAGASVGTWLGPKILGRMLPHKGKLDGASFQRKQMKRK